MGSKMREKAGLLSLWESSDKDDRTGVSFPQLEGYVVTAMAGRGKELVVKLAKKGCCPWLAGVCSCGTVSTEGKIWRVWVVTALKTVIITLSYKRLSH